MLSTRKEQDPLAGLILVVDDNEIDRYVASKLLTQWGFEVDLAENGQIAVEMITTKQYDLILMDTHMPILNGFEATEIIRSYNNGEFTELPIVALTTAVLEKDLDEINRSGMTGYIPKPFVPESFRSKVIDTISLHHTSPGV